MKCPEVNFRQCTYCLQNLGITCIACSFSPLHEMPDIFWIYGLPVYMYKILHKFFPFLFATVKSAIAWSPQSHSLFLDFNILSYIIGNDYPSNCCGGITVSYYYTILGIGLILIQVTILSKHFLHHRRKGDTLPETPNQNGMQHNI